MIVHYLDENLAKEQSLSETEDQQATTITSFELVPNAIIDANTMDQILFNSISPVSREYQSSERGGPAVQSNVSIQQESVGFTKAIPKNEYIMITPKPASENFPNNIDQEDNFSSVDPLQFKGMESSFDFHDVKNQ